MNREEAGATAASSLEGTNTGACSKSLLLQSAPKKWLWQVKWRFLARMACYHLYSASEQGSKKMKDNWLQTTSKIQRIFLFPFEKTWPSLLLGLFKNLPTVIEKKISIWSEDHEANTWWPGKPCVQKLLHSMKFSPKYCHFGSAFCDEIDGSFSRFLSLTWVLIDSILLLDV